MLGTITPASPGFDLVSRSGSRLEYQPIIAWTVTQVLDEDDLEEERKTKAYLALPITALSAMATDMRQIVIRIPDRSFIGYRSGLSFALPHEEAVIRFLDAKR